MHSFSEWLRLDEALAGNLDKENRILRYLVNYRRNQHGFPPIGYSDLSRIADALNEKLPKRSDLRVTLRDIQMAYIGRYGSSIMPLVAQLANNLATPQEIASDLGIPFSAASVKTMIKDLIKSDEVDVIYDDLLKVKQQERRKKSLVAARAAPRLGIEGKIRNLVPGDFVIIPLSDIGKVRKAFNIAQELGFTGTSYGANMIFHMDEAGLVRAQEAIKRKQLAI